MTTPLPDAAPANWVDRRAPAPWRPWLKLARLDRPVGIWLLMLPGWQGVALAGAMAHKAPEVKLLALFAAGAVLMRSAGCAVNDIVDRRIDAKVSRTAGRPVASGEISVPAAAAFALVCTALSGGVLLALNLAGLWIAAASLPLVVAYPFMKRITWWPQAWLGLAFNWGVLLGFGAALGGPTLAQALLRVGPMALLTPPLAQTVWPLWKAALALYASGVFWTLGYDTIYAVQDMADDVTAGVKSSALRLGDQAKTGVRAFYGISLLFALAAAVFAKLGPLFLLGLLVLMAHLARQVSRLDVRAPSRALAIFQSNTTAGFILFAAIVAGSWRI